MKITALIILVVGSLLVAGCSTRMFDLSVVSTKGIDLEELDLTQAKKAMHVTGVSSRSIIIIFPLGNPCLQEAIDDALTSASGDIMTDVAVYYNFWYIPFIYGQFGYEVVGDVIKTREWTEMTPVR